MSYNYDYSSTSYNSSPESQDYMQSNQILYPKNYPNGSYIYTNQSAVNEYEQSAVNEYEQYVQPGHVPVYASTNLQGLFNESVSNYPINKNYTQTINNNHQVQYIKPEDAKSCCTLSAIDIVAICAISLFAVAVIALALTINPFIAISLVALPIAIPSYIGGRMCCCPNGDDEDDDAIESQQHLMSRIDQANQNSIYQTISPIDELQTVYNKYS